MSASDRIKDRMGAGTREDGMYHPDDGEAVDPELVEDPDTLNDSSKSGLVGTVMSYKWVALGWGILLAAVLGYLTWVGSTFFISFVTNPLVIAAAVIAAYTAFVGVMVWNRARRKLRHTDTYVQHSPLPNKPMRRFHGEYVTSKQGNSVFIPYKGTRWFGLKWEAYRRADFGFEERPDEPVKILVRRQASVRRTETGTYISHISPEFELSRGGIAELKPDRPELADKETVRNQKEEIENLKEQIEEQESKIQTLRERAQNAEEMAKEQFDKHLSQFKRHYTDMREAEPSRVTTGLESGLGDIENALEDDE
ncbi:hypothetical protein [Halopenitus persicus]|uniref:hypothetical protein n=1 Tax=Halopenitus persicus TaxID=1048396 RepID=UPI0012FD6800|nr:hypothetical protein [Halopenitus persicus]